MNPITLRSAEPADIHQLYALLEAKAEFDGASGTLTATELELGRAIFCESPKCHFVVAVDGRTLVGFASYYPIFSTYSARPGLWMDDLFVLAECRGQGIGRSILKFVAGEAAKRHCCKLEWSLHKSNARGIAFYEREGAVVREQNRFAKLNESAIKRLLST
ncbi:MAG TPA: GNAT family N-acetyltransferase [Steroidobacteraceae bacterium]|nr:GNAT family N-acetyltransferase [Steroidobacteraceae bacterium]